jgi:hypothetical protein
LHSIDPLDQFRDPLDPSNANAPNDQPNVAIRSFELNDLAVTALREHGRRARDILQRH